MAFKNIPLTIDTMIRNPVPVEGINQEDNVELNIVVTENKTPKDLSGQTIKVYVRRIDGTLVEQTNQITPTNARKGEVTVKLKNSAFNKEGYALFQLDVSDSIGRITSSYATFKIGKGLVSGEAIANTNEVNALKQIEEYVKKANQELETFDQTVITIKKDEAIRQENERVRIENEEQRKLALKEYQPKNDEELQTENKKIVGAINEVSEKALVNGNEIKELKIGIEGEEFETASDSLNYQIGVISSNRLKKGTNLFDKRLAIKGKYIGVNGEITTNKLGFLTNYIKVENEEKYRNNWCDKIIALNSRKEYIKQLIVGSGGFIIDDENIKYILGCGAIEKLSETMIYEGTNQLSYEEFKTFFEADFAKLSYELREKSLKKENFNTDIVDENSCSFILKSKNLFDKSKVTKGYYIDPGTGRLIENESFWVSDYIEVSPNTQYTIRYKNQFSEFENKNGVGYNGGGGYSDDINAESSTFITKKNTKFVRFCGHNTQLDTDQLEKGDAFTGFVEHGYKIREDLLPVIKLPIVPERNKTPKETIARIFDKSKHTNIKLVGDSITHGQGGTGFKQDGEVIGTFFNDEYRRNPNGHCWANSFRDYLQEKFNCTVTNNAVMGTSTVELVNNFDTLISDSDDIVICMYGTNNRINNYGKSSFEPNLQTIIDKCKAKDIDLILMASIPTSVAQEENKTETNFHMEDVNHSIAKVCYKNDIEYVNVYQRFLEYCRFTKTPIDNLLADGLHPNDTGYDVIFDIVCGELGIAIKRDGATW